MEMEGILKRTILTIRCGSYEGMHWQHWNTALDDTTFDFPIKELDGNNKMSKINDNSFCDTIFFYFAARA